MAFIDDLTLGRYVPRDSLLHRLDPRLKLAGLPLFVIASFAMREPGPLGALTLLAAVLSLTSRIGWRLWWRGIWALRWLLLFSVLLHLFLSPGRTLFGVTWLSFDGLLRGLQVSWQLSLAVMFSSLLTLTTPADRLAEGFASLLAPLQRVGLPVREWAQLLGLVLQFIPILREEALDIYRGQFAQAEPQARPGLQERARRAGGLIAPLMLRLADRADMLALRMAGGQAEESGGAGLAPLWPLRPAELVLVLGCLAALAGIWVFF